MQFECQRAQSYYQRAHELWDNAELPTLFPAMIMKTIYQKILNKIVACQYDVLARDVKISSPVKFWIALKIYLGSRLSR